MCHSFVFSGSHGLRIVTMTKLHYDHNTTQECRYAELEGQHFPVMLKNAFVKYFYLINVFFTRKFCDLSFQCSSFKQDCFPFNCFVQWNLRITDKLVHRLMFAIRRLSFIGGFLPKILYFTFLSAAHPLFYIFMTY